MEKPTVSRLQARKFHNVAGAFPTFQNHPGVKRAVVVKSPRTKKQRSITKAKTLTEDQFNRVIREIDNAEHAARNSTIFHLSFYCGLRAQEIAGLEWRKNILNAEGKIGDLIHITKDIGKRIKERWLPINPALRAALQRLRDEQPRKRVVIYPIYKAAKTSERAAENKGHVDPNTLAVYMNRWFDKVGYDAATSHSGRRTFITGLAQRCNLEDTTLEDVRALAGHASIVTTAGYIESSPQLKKLNLVGRVWG